MLDGKGINSDGKKVAGNGTCACFCAVTLHERSLCMMRAWNTGQVHAASNNTPHRCPCMYYLDLLGEAHKPRGIGK